MNWKKLKWITVFTSLIVLVVFAGAAASDTVEWNVYRALQLDATPVDLVITPDGRRIFVLTDQGEILVYSSTTNIEATINVGKDVDQILLGPGEDTLILKSGKNKTVQVVLIDFVKDINTAGSPFKGPKDAPSSLPLSMTFSDRPVPGWCPYSSRCSRNIRKMSKWFLKTFPSAITSSP